MTDKEMAEKKIEFLEFFCVENEYSNCGYWWESGEGLEVHLDISSPEKVWDFVAKLVEEVETKTFIEGWTIGYELGLEKADKNN